MGNTVTRKDLASVLGEKTLHMKSKSDMIQSIAAYVASERLVIDLNSLVRDIMQYRLDRGIVEAVVVSAHELTPLVLADVKALLKEHFPEGREFVVTTRIDKALVGGVRIELPRENLDLSVKSKLNLFKRLVAEERN